MAEFRVEKHKKIFFFTCEAAKETLPFMATFVDVWQYKQSFSQGRTYSAVALKKVTNLKT